MNTKQIKKLKTDKLLYMARIYFEEGKCLSAVSLLRTATELNHSDLNEKNNFWKFVINSNKVI